MDEKIEFTVARDDGAATPTVFVSATAATEDVVYVESASVSIKPNGWDFQPDNERVDHGMGSGFKNLPEAIEYAKEKMSERIKLDIYNDANRAETVKRAKAEIEEYFAPSS